MQRLVGLFDPGQTRPALGPHLPQYGHGMEMQQGHDARIAVQGIGATDGTTNGPGRGAVGTAFLIGEVENLGAAAQGQFQRGRHGGNAAAETEHDDHVVGVQVRQGLAQGFARAGQEVNIVAHLDQLPAQIARQILAVAPAGDKHPPGPANGRDAGGEAFRVKTSEGLVQQILILLVVARRQGAKILPLLILRQQVQGRTRLPAGPGRATHGGEIVIAQTMAQPRHGGL